jgi:hypothetical protein
METVYNKQWLANQILCIDDNNYMKAHFYNLLYMMCINRFVWKNVPNNIDVDFIERELANNGELAFINDDIYGFQITYCVGDYINMYGRPQRYLCFTENNVINKYFEADEIVIIKNNKLSQTSHDFINRYASIIGEIQKTKEVNLNGLKTPIIIQGDENEILTLKNLYKQYDGNEPVIYGKKALNMEGLKVLKTDVPDLQKTLQQTKIDTLNECLNFMGIKTVADKKERMVTDEVQANDDLVNICLSMFLNTRQYAVEQINKKFNLNIELELADYCKDEVKPIQKEVTQNE